MQICSRCFGDQNLTPGSFCPADQLGSALYRTAQTARVRHDTRCWQFLGREHTDPETPYFLIVQQKYGQFTISNLQKIFGDSKSMGYFM